MQFHLLALALLPALISASSLIPRTAAPDACFPFNFTDLFTVSLNIGQRSKPIPIPGGILINEPVINGTVSGPGITATITGGFAHPAVYLNNTLQVPVIDIYGVTDDGQDFYIHETGIGLGNSQVTRIEINIGGAKYQQLANGFILASVNPSADKATVTVRGYAVQNILS